MSLDPRAIGGELREKLENHERLTALAVEASEAADAARAALAEAKKADMDESVQAMLGGEDRPERTHEDEAEIALKAAVYDSQVAQRAALAAQDQAADEALHGVGYDDELAEREESITAEAVEKLKELEALVERVAEVRSLRGWLRQPVRGDKIAPVTRLSVLVQAEGFRKPNGQPGDALDMTRAVLGALRQEPERPAHESYGFPKGMQFAGPYGVVEPMPGARPAGAGVSGPAAKVFAEMAAASDGGSEDDES